VDHGVDIGPRLEDFTLDEPFLDAEPSLRIDKGGIEVVFHDVVRGHQDGRERAGQQIAVRIAGMPHTHVPVGVEHPLGGENAVGRGEVLEESRIDGTAGGRWRLRNSGP